MYISFSLVKDPCTAAAESLYVFVQQSCSDEFDLALSNANFSLIHCLSTSYLVYCK